MRARFSRVVFGIVAVIFLAVASSSAEPIRAVSVSGFGDYGDDVEVLIDQDMPKEETDYKDQACVYWYSDYTYFIIDLGRVVHIQGIAMQMDNNDDYFLEASLDGEDFRPLLYVSSKWGETPEGMETISTIKGDSEFIPQAVICSSRTRFLKLSARGGDEVYAVSEVMVFGDEMAGVAAPESLAVK